jgi:hypothetical protein
MDGEQVSVLRRNYKFLIPFERIFAGKPNDRGYNWVALFLGEINTGTLPSRLERSRLERQ